MAIDSIENNELAALSQSRIGSKCFVDDSQYTNLFGNVKLKKQEAKQKPKQSILNFN